MWSGELPFVAHVCHAFFSYFVCLYTVQMTFKTNSELILLHFQVLPAELAVLYFSFGVLHPVFISEVRL